MAICFQGLPSTSMKKLKPRKAHSYSQESCPCVSNDATLMPPPPLPTRSESAASTPSRGRASSVDLVISPPFDHHHEVALNSRRMSSSPARSRNASHKQRHVRRKESFEKVLNSQIMKAFHKNTDAAPTPVIDESRNNEDQPCLSGDEDGQGNILNMNKIKKLTKLS